MQTMDHYILQELIERGIIDEEDLLDQLAAMKRKEILSKHHHWFNEKDNRWYTHLPDDNAPGRRILRRRRSKKDLEDEIVKFYNDHEHLPTVDDMFELWIASKSNNVRSQTILRYRSTYQKYIQSSWLGSLRIKDLSFKLLSKYCTETIGKDKMKAKCWAGIRTDLIGIIRTAKMEGLTELSVASFKDLDIAKNAFSSTPILPGEDVITNAEEAKLCEYIAEHNDDIVLLGIPLLFKTGIRIGELAALKYSDFNPERGTLLISRTEEKIANPNYNPSDKNSGTKTLVTVRDRTKGADGWREIIIDSSTAELIQRIRELNPDGEYLFEIDGKRVKENVWSKRLPRLCAKLGIGKRAEKVVRGEKKSRTTF